ncbi:hypothetical protein EK904_006604 [Melospiza melodia maxima]|nr:hypothetical protein EK904_006604 [Melospiza melodia maxima]
MAGGSEAVAGVIDLGTVEIFPVFGAMQRGLIDQDTGLVLLEAQVISSDLVVPETSEKLSLEEALARNIIDPRAFQVLQELKDALQQVEEIRCEGRQLLPVAAAIEEGRISESIGLKILEAELLTGGFKSQQGRIGVETAVQEGLLPPQLHSRLLSHLECGKDLIDPNTAEKISLPELLDRCITHHEAGLRLLPVRQLAGGMVSLRSGREVSIFRALQEGLIDRQVATRLLEAQLFAGGIVDPRTGHRLTVDEAVRHHLIEQDLACTLLVRQLQTGGIVDTTTGERLSVDEALRRGLVAPRTALLVLESLWSFMGLLWPETGEVIPVADALEQGMLSTELMEEALSKRQLLQAVFIPETTEVVSWQRAVEQGILDREVVKELKATAIPDVLASVQLSGAPSRSQSSPGRSPTGQEEPLLRSADEKLMFHLMTHSYINIHDGQKVLLVDAEMNNLTKALIQSQENGSCAQVLEGFEEREAALESKPCNGLALQQLELQSAPSEGESEKILPPRSALENGEVVVGPEGLLLEDAEEFLRVEEQEQISPELESIRSETDAEFGKEQVIFTTRDKHQVKLLIPEPPSDLGSGLTRETEEMMIEAEEESKPPAADGVEGPEYQKRALESGAVVVKSEICITMGVPESRDRLKMVAEGSRGVREPGGEAGDVRDVREVYVLKEGTVENGVLGGEEDVLPARGEAAPAERQSKDTGTVLKVEEGEWEEVLGDEGPSLPPHEEQEAEDTLEKLLMQLQSGGITHEQTGRTLLLDEAVASGLVSGHTAVKLMERMKMFSGFFDPQARESLTTEDVIEEGLMDEELLQKVLTSDKAISGVLDPGNNFVYSIKDAAAVGLLDKETAMRILEGQVVTGGIVDLKRGKKVSVTLASNLGLVEPTSQAELVKLEKASKGKGTDEVTRQKLINLQAETSGIVDPASKQPLTVAESVEKGLLEKEKAFQLLTKQVGDGGIIHHVSGMRLSVDNAMKHGLISPALCKELRKAESVVRQGFVHPATKEKLPLPQAVSLGLLSPEFQRKVQEIQAESGSILDPASGQRLALSEAAREGLVPQQAVEKALSSSAMREGIVDPESCRITPYSELLKKCRIDVESGQRYLEVHPLQAVSEGKVGSEVFEAERLQVSQEKIEKLSDGAEPKARPEAVSYDTAQSAAAATEKSPKAWPERKLKPQEASEGGVHPQDEHHRHLHHPQAKAEVTPELPSVLGTVSLPEEAMVTGAVEKGIPKGISQVRAAQGKELREEMDGRAEKVERQGLEKEQLGTEVLHKEDDDEERKRRKEFVSAEGVVAGGEGAVVASGHGERVTSVVQETPAAPRDSVSVGTGKGGMGPAEPPELGVPVGDELAGERAAKHTGGETPRIESEQEKTSVTELKPTQKKKSKKKKAKQGSIPGDSAQPEEPAEKQLLPPLAPQEIPRRKGEEQHFVPRVPEPEHESSTEAAAGLARDAAKHRGGKGRKTIPVKDTETPREDRVLPEHGEAREVVEGGTKDGQDSSVALKREERSLSLEERMAQEDTRVETTQDVPSTATANPKPEIPCPGEGSTELLEWWNGTN